MATTSSPPPAQNPGSAVYTTFALKIYDFWVLLISNLYAWKCPTDKVLLPLYDSVLGERHLDVGVGTGYFPARALEPAAKARLEKMKKCKEVVLLDLNPNSLEATRERINSVDKSMSITTVQADGTTTPLVLPSSPSTPNAKLANTNHDGKFNSITLFYLLHCIPGPASRKTLVFDALAPHLEPTKGQLAGATILGKSSPMNWFAWLLMTLYNRMGTFDNWNDEVGVFEEGLRRNFGEVEVWTEGRVMLFRARKPKVKMA